MLLFLENKTAIPKNTNNPIMFITKNITTPTISNLNHCYQCMFESTPVAMYFENINKQIVSILNNACINY